MSLPPEFYDPSTLMPAPNDAKPKPYIVRAFDSVKDMETFINEMAGSYRAVSIADTNRYCTVLLELKK
jgi:hypothetical protein